MTSKQLATLITTILNQFKAQDCVTLNVKKTSTITDYMVICTATSARHLFTTAKHLIEEVKTKTNIKAISIDGSNESNWILVDFGDVIVHIMLQESREFYDLESLWASHAN